MSSNNERSIRVVPFSGKKKDWRMWQKQFLAVAGKREYKDVLKGTTKVPPHDAVLDLTVDADKLKSAARKANDNAYHDLVLANSQPVPFNIVDKAISKDLPDGDAAAAWAALCKKYDSKSPATVVTLSAQYSRARLENTSVDPDEWITYLEILQARLAGMNYDITERQLIIHILHHLPEDYSSVVDDLENLLDDATTPLSIETVKSRLHNKYERLNENSKRDDNYLVNGEALFNRKQFKGRCRICGKIWHKGENCWQNPNRRGKNNNNDDEKTTKPFGTYGSGFKGKCNFCGTVGHISKYCREKQNADTGMVAKKNKEDDGVSLMAMNTTIDGEIDEESSDLPELVEDDSSDDGDSSWDWYNDKSTKNSGTSSIKNIDTVRDKPWLMAELDMYRQSGFCVIIDTNEDDQKEAEQSDEDSEDPVPALMATRIASDEDNDESDDSDSWAERTIGTDDSIPYDDVVRSDTEYEDGDDKEKDRAEFMQYLDDLSLETENSLESFPDPHEVSDQELLRRMMMRGEYNEDSRRTVTDMLMRVLGISNEDVTSCERVEMSTMINEEKIEIYDEMSLHMTMTRYCVNEILTFRDYRMDANFSLLLVCRQREVVTTYSFVAIDFMCTALSGAHRKDILSDDTWIGDTGASCHMCTSMRGMYDMRNGSGGIKVGSGKILKILSVGKLKVNVQQKDGTSQVIILNDVNFVPDLYCNLFSITTALDENFVLSGGRNECLTLRKDHTIIRFDRNIQSGGGRLLGVRLIPTKLPVTKPLRISCDKAHRILNHAGEKATRATAVKLGWSIGNKMTECVHCAEAKARMQDIAKTQNHLQRAKET